MSSKDHHLEVLKLAVKVLEPLLEEIVFIGGATISLFVTEPQSVIIRPTEDVDFIVEVTHRLDYENFAKKLRALGFSEDIESKVICRFKKGSLIVDVMPTDSKILGFSNVWYREGFKNSQKIEFNGHKINVFRPEYLIASKLEAFKGRGRSNFIMSHDIEDIVTILDGRSSIAEDLNAADPIVAKALRGEFKILLVNEDFLSSLEAHISDRINLSGRKKIVIERMKAFADRA